MIQNNEPRIDTIAEQFMIQGEIASIRAYGSGHINDTYLVTMEDTTHYILQKMNTDIFANPDELMENVCRVTSYLREKIITQGGNPGRETITVIRTVKDEAYYSTPDKQCYRMYNFIEDATSYDQVESAEDFYQSAVSFGKFQALLKDYPAETLHETIPDFHNTVKRFQAFKQAVEADSCNRVQYAKPEIDFVLAHEPDMHILCDMRGKGELPLRVTHNDTKLNNIMIDNTTRTGICVIDLDTVMPGLSLYDFGDSIRFGASTAAEDETDISKVEMDLKLYEVYVKGYLEGCNGSLTKEECRMLPMGAKTMTLECGMRFLTDYLQGDTYFKIHRENHNLDRCRTQFALVADMERKWNEMAAIVTRYC